MKHNLMWINSVVCHVGSRRGWKSASSHQVALKDLVCLEENNGKKQSMWNEERKWIVFKKGGKER